MKKRIMVILAIVVVLISFSGCGKGKTVKTAVSGINEFKIFGSFDPETAVDKAFFEEWGKATNSKISVEAPPTSSYAERLQILLAGGNYPEVILFNDPSDKVFESAVKNGVVIPINTYMASAPNIQKYTYDVSWNPLKVKRDDNIYGIPRSTLIRNDGFALRKDWVKKLNIELPDDKILSLAQFTEILKAFKTKDPNGNGVDDTYGLAAFIENDGSVLPFVQTAFDLIGWQEYDGKYMNLMYSKDKDNMKRALQYSNMLYKEGLVDPNSLVNKKPQAEERFRQGTNGLVPAFAGHMMGHYDKMKGLINGVDLDYIVGVKDEQGVLKGAGIGAGFYGFYSITKSAKQPENVIKSLDWLLSDEGWGKVINGLEGVTYTVENGKKNPTDKSTENKRSRNLLRRKDATEFYSPETLPKEWYERQTQWMKSAIDTGVVTEDLGYKPAVLGQPKFMDAQKALNITIAKIISGEQPLTAYDKALDDWYNAGGTEYINQMNEYIKSNKSKN